MCFWQTMTLDMATMNRPRQNLKLKTTEKPKAQPAAGWVRGSARAVGWCGGRVVAGLVSGVASARAGVWEWIRGEDVTRSPD